MAVRGFENAENLLSPCSDPLSEIDNDKQNEDADCVGQMTASPSIDSISSSVLATMKLEDDEFYLDSRDIMVRVDNPEKHAGVIDSYMTFRIVTKTTRSDYDSHEYSVRRRYRDFIWLRQKLEETYPTHVIPPLPEKHSMQRMSRFNADFIKSRMLALHRFVNRVADHPVLSFDKSFQLFLTAKPFEFAAHRKEVVGIIGRVTNSFQNMAATYMMKIRPPEFEAMNEYLQRLGEKLGSIERIADRIQRERLEHCAELDECHPIYTLWSGSESRLEGNLTCMASALVKCSSAQQTVVSKHEESYAKPIREYVLYTEATKEALKRRDAIQIEYELTVDDLTRRKVEREHLKTANQSYSFGTFMGKDPEDVRKEKKEKLDHVIQLLIGQVDENHDKAECANANLRADMERWQTTKRNDLRSIFVTMANGQIDYYQKCLEAWEETITAMRDSDIAEAEFAQDTVTP